MVTERETDPRRIAQLLASEFTGLARGPLAAVDVVDADPEASPASDGERAYDVALAGERVGTVTLVPDRVVVELVAEPSSDPSSDDASSVALDVDAAHERARDALSRDGGPADGSSTAEDSGPDGVALERREDALRLELRDGASVKRAVDAVAAVLSGSAGAGTGDAESS